MVADISNHRFIVFLKPLRINHSGVKSGRNPKDIVTVCRCVNVALFLSGDLRRNVVIDFAFEREGELEIISFPGQSLKRVSPDERSISFFLLKAKDELEIMDLGDTKIMSNGINIQRVTHQEFVKGWIGQIHHAVLNFQPLQDISPSISKGLFLYEVASGVFNQEFVNDEITKLSRPSTPERFILDLNFMFDNRIYT